MKLEDTDHRLLALWAADCAEHVLVKFGTHVPDDARPRQAIWSARAWERGDLSVPQARAAAFAAHAAAREARGALATAAARAAGHAAAAAHVVTHARHAATYARKAAGGDAASEWEWQLQSLPDRLRAFVVPAD
ncbi:putative immunity protein [Deinococcus sp.]|uniref:putative immunity protein n=1 Tax=Deinococcus sp. TaxID=47478 RepID=UPI003C7AFBEF